jgi:hypothetical protein
MVGIPLSGLSMKTGLRALRAVFTVRLVVVTTASLVTVRIDHFARCRQSTSHRSNFDGGGNCSGYESSIIHDVFPDTVDPINRITTQSI